jgi:hypothetical protein
MVYRYINTYLKSKNSKKAYFITLHKEARCLFLFFVLVLSMPACMVTKKSVRKINGIEVYECLNGTGEKARNLMSEIGIGQMLLLGENLIFDSQLKELRKSDIKSTLDEKVPSHNYNGIIVLDWEGEKMSDILEGAADGTGKFISASEMFIQAYDYVKLLRPRATVGFYGFPARNYWNRNEEWEKQNQKIGLFLSQFDAIFPSVYDFYETTDANREQELSYVRENVAAALEVGARYKLPVYPFVWHRYHDSNKEVGLNLIPLDEFREHVREVSSTVFNGEKVKGIIWWSAERYFYNIRKTNQVKSASDFTRQTDDILPGYLNTLLEAIKESKKGE